MTTPLTLKRRSHTVQDYHQLDIWHRAMDYTVSVYKFSADLPEGERYNLSAQLRRGSHFGAAEHRRRLRLHE